jgi:hypothetical protein
MPGTTLLSARAQAACAFFKPRQASDERNMAICVLVLQRLVWHGMDTCLGRAGLPALAF